MLNFYPPPTSSNGTNIHAPEDMLAVTSTYEREQWRSAGKYINIRVTHSASIRVEDRLIQRNDHVKVNLINAAQLLCRPS